MDGLHKHVSVICYAESCLKTYVITATWLNSFDIIAYTINIFPGRSCCHLCKYCIHYTRYCRLLQCINQCSSCLQTWLVHFLSVDLLQINSPLETEKWHGAQWNYRWLFTAYFRLPNCQWKLDGICLDWEQLEHFYLYSAVQILTAYHTYHPMNIDWFHSHGRYQ